MVHNAFEPSAKSQAMAVDCRTSSAGKAQSGISNRGLPQSDNRSGMFMLPLEFSSPQKVSMLLGKAQMKPQIGAKPLKPQGAVLSGFSKAHNLCKLERQWSPLMDSADFLTSFSVYE